MKIVPIRNWNIIGRSKIFVGVSIGMVIVSLLFCLINVFTIHTPFNFGVDFTGGVVMNLDFDKPVDEAKIRSVMDEFKQASAVIQLDQRNKNHAMIRLQTITDKDKIVAALDTKIGKINRDTLQIELVGPTVGAELRRNAILTTAIALFLILIYVAFRFQFKHGLAAILALIHDVGVSLGVVALFRVQLNMPSVAAILTILAFSLQDSIVILDRLRENLKYRKGNETFAEIANRSVTETWTRSFNTSFMIVLATASLAIFSGAAIRDFTTILLVGMIAGTYSSIYIVVPMVMLWEKKDQQTIRDGYIAAQNDDELRTKLVTGSARENKKVMLNSNIATQQVAAIPTTVAVSKKKKTNRRR
jgi:preprotein translocase SecF subunit